MQTASNPLMTLKQIILYPLYWWLKKYGYIEKPITPGKREQLYRTLNKLH